MNAIENAAFLAVGRACGFAGFAVFCMVFGLSFDPPFAARIGGLICLGITGILLYSAYRAPLKPYKRTHLWLMLTKDNRPPEGIAQRLVGEALRDCYLWFAKQAAIITGMLFAASIVLQLIGFGR